jgi:hypothetical protein
MVKMAHTEAMQFRKALDRIVQVVVEDGNPQQGPASEKESTCILPFVHRSVHVITCSSFMWLEIHASTKEFTCFFHVRTSLVTESPTLFSRGQKDVPNSLLIHAK